MTVVRSLPLEPDPLAIARSLSGRPGLAALVSQPTREPRPDDARWSFVACDPDDSTRAIVPAFEPRASQGWNGAPAAPKWIGVVPYDALRGIERPGWTRSPETRPPPLHALPTWRRYPAVVRIDHLSGAVSLEADDEAAAARLLSEMSRSRSPNHAGFELRLLPAGEPDQAHIDRVREALRLIAEGDLYQVNLARRILLHLRGDPLTLFASLLDAAPAPWAFYQDLGESIVCGSSPELALSVTGEHLRTCPIKGTRPRGSHAEEDGRLSRELDLDPKERAELVMAIDVHRSDLGSVAATGSVAVMGEPRLLAGRTVWSRVGEVVARRAPRVGLEAVVRAVLPCGSVTGAPKVRAMEVIAALEPWRRGAYTGVFGHVARDGAMSLAMAIRTLEISKVEPERTACYFAGGGIVADSIPERELEETRWKAAQLENLGA